MAPLTSEAAAFPFATFNAWIGQRDEQLERNLGRLTRRLDDPILALQEVWDWGGTIPGYQPVRASREKFPHRESRSTILLVPDRFEIVHEGARQVDGPDWIGPKHGILHPPRVFPRATVKDPDTGQLVDVIAVHRTPGGPNAGIVRNRASWAAEDACLVEWVGDIRDAHPRRPIVILGDHNDRVAGRERLGIADLARRLDARPVMRGIDGGLLIGCDPKRGATTELDGLYGGDGHRPVAFTATTKGIRS